MTDQPSTQLYAFVGIVTALAVVALGCLTVGLALLAWLSLGGV
jgi:hypothetical protein